MKKKIYIIGLSLYSIIIALKIKKNFKEKISVEIIEASKNFLNSYNSIKIGKYKCNPGFHALENIRSTKLLSFLRKYIKFKKIKKTRGILIGDYLISYKDTFKQWPTFFVKKNKLSGKLINLKNLTHLKKIKKISHKYLHYLKNNICDNRMSFSNIINIIYPWFFPPNYKINSYDEGTLFNQKIRDGEINHSFLFPSSGLFHQISNKLKYLLDKKNVKFIKNKKLEFCNEGNDIIIENYHKKINKKDSLKIICVPVIPLFNSIKNKNFTFKKLEPVKLYTALIEVNNPIKNAFENYCEVIVSSEKTYGLRRISLYSEIVGIKNKKIYQVEFGEHKKIPNVEDQINDIISLFSQHIIFRDDKRNNIICLGYKFLRLTFSPNVSYLNTLADKVDKFFKKSNNILFPRKITWPINSNKHMHYASYDYNKFIKSRITKFIKNE